MKILYITEKIGGSDGWAKYSEGVVNEAVTRGYDVRVVVSEKTTNSAYQNPCLKKSYHYMANPVVAFISGLKIKKEIEVFKPDIVHFLIEPYLSLCTFIKFDQNTKVFLTIHGTYSFTPAVFTNLFIRWISGSILRGAFNKLSGIISVSDFTRLHFLKLYKNYYGKEFTSAISVVTNGVNNKQIEKKDDKEDIDFSKKKTILFVGAVKRRKGLLQSLEALRLFRDEVSTDFIFRIVGSFKANDPYYLNLLDFIKKYDMEKNVQFLGRLSDEELRLEYNNADLFMMLSVKDGSAFEGFGIVYLEANAYGVPVIGAVGSGAGEAILHDKTGYVVDPSKPNEVSSKIASILINKTISKDNCLMWAKRNDISEKFSQIVQFYERS